jgi:endonuclease YncB( thermonuclease family)
MYRLHARFGAGAARPNLTPAAPLALMLILALALAANGYWRAGRAGRLASPQTHETWGAPIIGKAWVIDGDTIVIHGIHIRLTGIDAPESAQACTDADGKRWLCGHAATHVLIRHIAGEQLRCETSGLDRYRRVLADCWLPDGSDMNAWLVREGWALAYGHSSPYRDEEAQAQAGHKGIWIGTFIPPWVWRHHHGFMSPAALAGAR